MLCLLPGQAVAPCCPRARADALTFQIHPALEALTGSAPLSLQLCLTSSLHHPLHSCRSVLLSATFRYTHQLWNLAPVVLPPCWLDNPFSSHWKPSMTPNKVKSLPICAAQVASLPFKYASSHLMNDWVVSSTRAGLLCLFSGVSPAPGTAHRVVLKKSLLKE